MVEDEAIIRMVAADALTDRGIMTWKASGADEALFVLEQQSQYRRCFHRREHAGAMDN